MDFRFVLEEILPNEVIVESPLKEHFWCSVDRESLLLSSDNDKRFVDQRQWTLHCSVPYQAHKYDFYIKILGMLQ